MKKKSICLFLILIVLRAYNQETYDIKHPGYDLNKKCGDYLIIYNRLPIEVRYSLVVEDGTILFYFNERYFDLLFDKNSDGIAVDVVKRNQYKCYEKNRLAKSNIQKGYLMPPIYLEEINEKAIRRDGFVIVPTNLSTMKTLTNASSHEYHLVIYIQRNNHD